MKRYLVLLAAVWLMLGFAWLYEASADDTAAMYVHVREGTYLNGRREPNLDSPILMKLGRGDAVDAIGVDNGWAEIRGGEAGTCWCCADYLASYPPGHATPLYRVASNGRVRVRQSPDGKTVCYLQDGDTVEVRFVIDGWAYLGDGYVMAEYLERRENNEK